jgi:hypothetical protein
MRKVMLLAAMLAMVLAAAAPVFAQDVNVTTGDNVEYNAICQNIIGSIGDISATQSGTAAAGNASDLDDSVAIADVAQEQNVTIAQANECLNNVDVNGDGILVKKEILLAKKFVTVSATATVAGKVQYGGGKTVFKGGPPAAKAAAVLPETGGAPLIAVGTGVLLVAGGLLARRIVR